MLLKLILYFQAMTIKHLLAPNKKSFWIALFWTFFILFLSLKRPSGEATFYFPNADKLVHFTFYFVFVFLWSRYLYFKGSVKLRHKIILVFISISLGIVIELVQGYFTTTRQADVWDAIANSVGSIVGILLASNIYKVKEPNNS